MTDTPQTIADPFADLLKNVQVCGCGSCRDALDAAFKEAAELLKDNCPAWYLARVYAHGVIASTIVNIHTAQGDIDMYLRVMALENVLSEDTTFEYVHRTIVDMTRAMQEPKN